MNRDAILGYTREENAFFIRLFEDDQAVSAFFGMYYDQKDEEEAEKIMSLLYVKKLFWLNGTALEDTLKGLDKLTPFTC